MGKSSLIILPNIVKLLGILFIMHNNTQTNTCTLITGKKNKKKDGKNRHNYS